MLLTVCALTLPFAAKARTDVRTAFRETDLTCALLSPEEEPPNSTPPADTPDLAAEEATLVDRSVQEREQEVLSETAREQKIDLPPAPDQLALPEGESLQQPGSQAVSPTQRKLRYEIGVSVRTVYDDNINISHTDRKSDIYTTLEATIDLGYGDPENNFVALVYVPSIYIFADHSENDAFQQSFALTAQYRLPRVTLGLSQTIELLDGTGLNSATGTGTDFTRTNIDVAARTKVNIFNTRLDANYSLTGKTFLTGSLNYSLSDYESLLSSSVISGNAYINYTYSPKLSIGIGGTLGYDAIDSPSDDQTFEQLNFRASYELTGKVSASLSAGFEFRQTENGGDDNGSPVFDATLLYQPFDGTNVAITLSRRTQNSATLAGQDYHSTSFIASVRQRFFQRFFVGLSLGYENSSYFTTSSGIDSNRSDDYFFVQFSLDTNVTRFLTIGIYDFYRESDSSLDAFSFYDNQIGLRASFTF